MISLCNYLVVMITMLWKEAQLYHWGNVPMDVLAKNVDEYVAVAKG